MKGEIPQPSSSAASFDRADRLIALVLALGAFVLYIPSLFNDFVEYDDPHYIQGQPMVKAGLTPQGVRWAFTTTTFANWLPITWLSHQLDVQLWGLNAGGHHADSALLHAINGAVLFLFLRSATGSRFRSAAVAAIFLVHPLRVESVAWVAERKDVLAGTFFLLMLLAYVPYARRPTLGRYALVAFCFALGLMSKTMLVTAPFVLLLLDYWPLRRIASLQPADESASAAAAPARGVGWLVVEKLPLLAMAVVASGWTVVLQKHGGAMQGGANLTLGQRLANAIVSIPRYLDKMVRPSELSVFYPHPGSWPVGIIAAAAAAIIVVTLFTLTCWKSRPYLTVGWLWFLGMLAPVSGVIQVGLQAMADRYTYLPGVGVLIAAAWALPPLLERRPALHRLLKPATGGVVAILAVATALQQRYWADTFSLFTHAYVVDPDNWLANDMLGVHYTRAGKYALAEPYLQKAAAMQPSNAEVRHNLGVALDNLGRKKEAIRQFSEAIRLFPMSLTCVLLAEAQAAEKNWPEADAAFEEARRLSPGAAEVPARWGWALLLGGRREQAIERFQQALQDDPHYEAALGGLAEAKRQAATRPTSR